MDENGLKEEEKFDDSSEAELSSSPLDIEGVDVEISADEIVEIVREGREQS